MRNGYFQLVNAENGYGVKLYPPTEGGDAIRVSELMDYLGRHRIEYDMVALNKAVGLGTETVFFLSEGECPICSEEYAMEISEDSMRVTARFYPRSETGKEMSFEEFANDLKYKNIVFGIRVEEIQKHFTKKERYCTDLVVACGQAPRQGADAQIAYFFNTEIQATPAVRDDDTVDYFNLGLINHCQAGQVLAKLTPADEGTPGMDVTGKRLMPRQVKRLFLKPSENVTLSEDKLQLVAAKSGHVVLEGERVLVSDVFEVKNVDLSTGNIEYDGSVQIQGNVANNMRVVASGNVVINGAVEGAYIEAGGNIIIAGGMNGMSKGTLRAGGDIVIKFMENVKAYAGGYIQTESAIYSEVSAGTQVVVTGKKGLITGGHVQAGEKIIVKTLGSELGAATVVEVGVNPVLRENYQRLQKEVAELFKTIKNIQPILVNFAQKRAKGVQFTQQQVLYIKSQADLVEEKKVELVRKNEELKQIQAVFETEKAAVVEVQGTVCSGTTIIIGDLSMTVPGSLKYCKFVKQQGSVQMVPL